VIRFLPASLALIAPTFAASMALAAAQDIAPNRTPAAAASDAKAEPVTCQVLRERMAALTPPAAPSRGRQLFGFAAAVLQAAGPSLGGYGGSSAGSVVGAIAQQGAMQAMQTGATAVPAADARQRLAVVAEDQGC
jgi:hypothetical protein